MFELFCRPLTKTPHRMSGLSKHKNRRENFFTLFLCAAVFPNNKPKDSAPKLYRILSAMYSNTTVQRFKGKIYLYKIVKHCINYSMLSIYCQYFWNAKIKKSPDTQNTCRNFSLERITGLEPATSTLARSRSTKWAKSAYGTLKAKDIS